MELETAFLFLNGKLSHEWKSYSFNVGLIETYEDPLDGRPCLAISIFPEYDSSILSARFRNSENDPFFDEKENRLFIYEKQGMYRFLEAMPRMKKKTTNTSETISPVITHSNQSSYQ